MVQKYNRIPVFQLINNHCEFSTCTNKFKCILYYTEIIVLNVFSENY